MITSRVFNGPPGASRLSSVSIRRVRLLGVEREGIGYEIIPATDTPVGNQVSYVGSGTLIFDESNPFNGSTVFTGVGGTDGLEKIYVLYET